MKIKNIAYLGIAGLCISSLTGCIEETVPMSDMVVEEQVQQSSTATESMALGMPAGVIDVWTTDSHAMFGYPAIMIQRDVQTGDYMFFGEMGYCHFTAWQQNKARSGNYLNTQFTWNFYYGFLLNINQVVGAVNPENSTDAQKGYLGAALGFRAMCYLDLARMYEFLPTEVFPDGKNAEGNVVTNLTCPIVSNVTTPSEAANNPRATRQEMFDFIEKDLNDAEQYIVYLSNRAGNTLPDLACIYGLKARLYMWVEDYAKAADYADKAIKASTVAPYTEEKALNMATGYNTAADFMWAAQQTSENYCVKTGIINWTSWASNQTTFGYTGAGTNLYSAIDKSLYDRIPNSDWRKKQWVAPKGSVLDGQNTSCIELGENSTYVSTKFRPGQGEVGDYNIGAATAIPLMRVEEMHFIKAEALAHTGGDAISALNEIMKTRNPSYSCTKTGEMLIDEIVFQKRVELWGEGQTFFDVKRLDMSVTRGYSGTNWKDTQSVLNTNGRPAWMNYVMVITESNNNKGVEGWNNPDPTDLYTPWTE